MHEALLIHGGALGDFVLSLRVVASLRKSGVRRVTLLGRSEFAGLAKQGGVDEFIDLHTGGCHALFSPEAAWASPLTERFARFDLVIDMLSGRDSPLPGNLLSMGISRVLSIDPRPRPGWEGHISDQWLDDLHTGGLDRNVGPPQLILDSSSVETAKRHLQESIKDRSSVAVIHPGSGSRDKCWPVERFVRLIDELRSQHWGVVVLLGPVELERFDSTVLARLRAAALTMENRTLDEVAGLMAAANLFIGNDSGVSHLAAAVGTPTIAIFGPTDARRWRPLGDQVAVVSADAGRWPDVMDIASVAATMASGLWTS